MRAAAVYDVYLLVLIAAGRDGGWPTVHNVVKTVAPPHSPG
jgi:hypothetical protein